MSLVPFFSMEKQNQEKIGCDIETPAKILAIII